MRLCVFTEPQQGATYHDLLAVARRAEECGFDGFFRSDHYLAMGDGDGLPGPTDAWVTLGALARETSRVRLGTLVTSATFRLPGPLAVAVAQVDAMSGGRVELGLGAGWFEAEHSAYGIPFPPTGERFDRLAEQLAVITGLWATPPGATFSFAGKHFTLEDSPALPKPVQRPAPPVIVGGYGRKRTPALAARYATEFNVPFGPVEETAARFEWVRAACAALGDARTAPIVFSVAQTVVCGRSDAEVRRRAEAIGRDPDSAGRGIVIGTPEQVAEQLTAFVDIGAERMFLQVLDLSDLDHLDLIASEVAPRLRRAQGDARSSRPERLP
jgi:F420-dependent oxidoreductase-like protein